jgi:K+-sensing histidine kinase KdpD
MQRHVAASGPVRYGIAVLFVTGASALALLIRPVTLAAGQLSLVAILLTGWICGLRPALVAWALTTVAFVYFFTSPFDSLAIDPAEIPRLLIFFTVLGLFMATVSAARRRAPDAQASAGSAPRRRSSSPAQGSIRATNFARVVARDR